MDNEKKIIDVLTTLIDVNDKRVKMYESFALKEKHGELKSILIHGVEQSKEFSKVLSNWRSANGAFGMPEKRREGVWGRVVSLIDHLPNKNVNVKCEEEEQHALKVYRAMLQFQFLPVALAKDLERQTREFEKSLAKLKTLREHAGSNRKNSAENWHTIGIY